MIWIITWDQYCRLSLAWISEKTGFLMIEIISMIAFYDDKFSKIFDHPYQQSPIFLYKKFQKVFRLLFFGNFFPLFFWRFSGFHSVHIDVNVLSFFQAFHNTHLTLNFSLFFQHISMEYFLTGAYYGAGALE